MSCPPHRRSARAERWETRADSAAKRVARATRQADRRTNHQVLGAVLLAVGGNWLLAELGLFPFGWPGLLAAGLMTLGIAMIGTAKAGRTKPLVGLGILMTFFLAMSSGVGGAVGGPDFGEQSYTPRSAQEIRPEYGLGAGELTLDLRNVEFEDGERLVAVEVGMGDIAVLLPREVAVDIDAHIGAAGDVRLLGIVSEDGFRLDVPHTDPNFADSPRRLELDLTVAGFGDITVVRD